ncbi:MAG TPA: LamG-like jellyroll fold domain-containing protein, partial [Verrucomicrobiaceae bacterium]
AGSKVMGMWKDLDTSSRRLALDRLCTTKTGAHAVVAALHSKILKADDMDASALDRLQTVLGPKDSELASIMSELSALFRPALRLDGGKDNYVETGLTLDGPFTVETWVRLDPDIGNEDGILGSPGQLDMNFFKSQFRVWVGGETHDAIIAKRKMAPDNWTHVAVTRDARGMFRIYFDGELDQDVSKPAPQKFENVRVGWAQPVKGMQGMLSEFRIWNSVRTPEEIRNNFDRVVPDDEVQSAGLIYHGSGDHWGKLHGKARVAKSSDLPPLLTAGEARKLDEKFAKYRTLAQKSGGDPTKGKMVAGICLGCHLIQGQGGNLAPNISGAGTMGLEALLRNIITPNAAMEAGYRIYRVELKSGDIVDAFFVNEDKDAVVVRLPGVPDRRIPKSEIRNTKYIRRSLMPEGILDALQPEMVTDLFAYLMSLKG